LKKEDDVIASDRRERSPDPATAEPGQGSR
jgi:hypothetical protein